MNDLTKPNSQDIITAAPQAFVPQFDSNLDNNDIVVPYASLYQGTNKERENFPGIEPGSIYSRLTKRAIEDPTFMVVRGYKQWSRYDEDTNERIYRYDSIDEVPEEDREWTETPSGKRVPPLATESINFVIIFRELPVPHIFSFKKTAHRAGRHLYTMAKTMPGCLYTFAEPYVEENAKKDKYLVPNPTIASGAPTQHMIDLAKSIVGKNIQADDSQSDEVPF